MPIMSFPLSQEEIDNENLKNMITSIIKKVPKIKGPLEPNSIPPLDLSQESEEGKAIPYQILL